MSANSAAENSSSKKVSLLDMVSSHEPPNNNKSLDKSSWIKIAILGLLFLGFAWETGQLRNLWQSWGNDPNWSHGFLIPLFSIYLLYIRWNELLSAPRKTSWFGLVLMILSIAAMIYAFGAIGNYWLCQLSMIGIILGLVWFNGGKSILRITWLPIVYLALAMPVPDILYQQVAVPLQNLAAAATTIILKISGVQMEVSASSLTITSMNGVIHQLTVAEACSGVRSLMAFIALSIAMAYIDDRPLWQRLVLVGSALPITVLCNIIRVAATCTMYVIDRPELGQDVMHKFMGMVLLVPALLMLLGLSWLLKNLFVDHGQDDEEDGESQAVSEAI